jgi:D-serine deaminase-like pyridoxal phosphate-dependent protein
MEQDIHFFKATPNEVEMLAAAGAPEVLVAYPLLAADAAAQIDTMKRHPATRFFLQISQPEHARILQQAAEAADLNVSCFIDLDVGMARTGTAPQKALDLYRKLPQFPRLIFAGLHAYDGHIHQLSAEERQLQAGISMDRLQTALDQFCAAGVSIERVVVAARRALSMIAGARPEAMAVPLYFSPGTWIYSTPTITADPGTFKPGADPVSDHGSDRENRTC